MGPSLRVFSESKNGLVSGKNFKKWRKACKKNYSHIKNRIYGYFIDSVMILIFACIYNFQYIPLKIPQFYGLRLIWLLWI